MWFRRSDITVTDDDCIVETATSGPVTQCSEDELQTALAAGTITLEQCLYMHEHQIDWNINVERKGDHT